MRLPSSIRLASAGTACLAALAAHAGVLTFDFSGLNLAVPDGLSSGVSDTRLLPAAGIVLDVNVTLRIRARDGTAVYNGDLYAALTHESGYAVLLNRTGRRAGSLLGYGDNGFNITLDDQAAAGDIHEYRLTLNGAHNLPLTPAGTALTGTWAPDGRLVPPATATLTDPRTAPLAGLQGLPVGGLWTLFVADWETGGMAALDGWGLQITVIPEPGAAAAGAALGLGGFAALRARRRRAG